MTNLNKHSAIIFGLSLVPMLAVATVMLSSPGELQGIQDEPAEDWRQVETKSQHLSLELPYHWRITIQERFPEEGSFLAAQEMDASGRLLPTALNIKYIERESDREYPIPDPDAYAHVFVAGLRASEGLEDVQLIEAKAVEFPGLTGALVKTTYLLGDHVICLCSLNAVATNPPRRYVLTYGTTADAWDQYDAIFDRILESIQVD